MSPARWTLATADLSALLDVLSAAAPPEGHRLGKLLVELDAAHVDGSRAAYTLELLEGVGIVESRGGGSTPSWRLTRAGRQVAARLRERRPLPTPESA